MRLLKVESDGEFSLTDDITNSDIPPYAILSHTWGSDREEVTFKDMVKGTGKSKAAMTRSGSAENKLLAMAYSTFGWTLVASINQAVLNSLKLSTPCFAGIVMLPNAMCTCQTLRHKIVT